LFVSEDLPQEAVILPEKRGACNATDDYHFVTKEGTPVLGPLSEEEAVEVEEKD
jgi:hypothetical protein